MLVHEKLTVFAYFPMQSTIKYLCSGTIRSCYCTWHQHCSCVFLPYIRWYLKIHLDTNVAFSAYVFCGGACV